MTSCVWSTFAINYPAWGQGYVSAWLATWFVIYPKTKLKFWSWVVFLSLLVKDQKVFICYNNHIKGLWTCTAPLYQNSSGHVPTKLMVSNIIRFYYKLSETVIVHAHISSVYAHINAHAHINITIYCELQSVLLYYDGSFASYIY